VEKDPIRQLADQGPKDPTSAAAVQAAPVEQAKDVPQPVAEVVSNAPKPARTIESTTSKQPDKPTEPIVEAPINKTESQPGPAEPVVDLLAPTITETKKE
jgi:hypothetical protein